MDASTLQANLEILPQLLINALITGSIYAIASSGLALTFGVSRILNFAHGHWMMLGAYMFYAFFAMADCGVWLSSLLCFFSMLGLGSLSYFVFIRPFVRLDPLLAFVSTLALSAILESAVSLIFGVNVLSFMMNDYGQSMSFESIGQFFITPWQIIIIISSVLILCALAVIIHYAGYGRSLRALAENPEACTALGTNGNRKLLSCYLLSVTLASIAGILVAFETNLQPTMGQNYTIKAFACMILGGFGNIWGAICGSMILGLIENLSVGLDFAGYSLPTGYKDAFAYFMILLTLLIRPQGLFGKKDRQV